MKHLALLIALSTASALARDVEPLNDLVSAFAEPKEDSAVLMKLPKKQFFESRDRIGAFLEIRLKDGRWGFVLANSVKMKKMAKQTYFAKQIKQRQDAQDPAVFRTRSSVVGALALQDSTLSSVGNSLPNLRMIYLMESLIIPKSEIEEFGTELSDEIARKRQVGDFSTHSK